MLPAFRALVVEAAGTETVLLTVTVTVETAGLSASGALVEVALRARTKTVFLIVTVMVGTAVLLASRALVVEVIFRAETEIVFPRLIVPAEAGGQSNGLTATRAASLQTAII